MMLILEIESQTGRLVLLLEAERIQQVRQLPKGTWRQVAIVHS